MWGTLLDPSVYSTPGDSELVGDAGSLRMGRREAGDSGMSVSGETELGSLQGITSPAGGSALDRHLRPSEPLRAPAGVRKHQHKHNLKPRYEVLETLGKGTYGKVKRAVERGTGKTVAIKSIRKERITDDLDRVHIQREIEIISSLKHPNIICIYEVFENRDKIVIVMEYASRGELYDYVSNRRKLPETKARHIFRQVTSAVHYCHKNGIVHRDLKLENILLDQDYNVKLADFGLSNHYHKDTVLQTYCGSPLYASPEIVNGRPYQGPEVDCWALGVLLYALLYGSMPFDSENYRTLTEQISQAKYKKPQCPSDACGLIDWMLTVTVEKRATIEDIANHWWVNWGFEESVCDCASAQDCHSPLLARYIDWQNRPNASTTQGSPELNIFFSFPLKPTGAGAQGVTCLKKSKKENDISQPATFIPEVDKKPKGILKTRSSFDSAFLSDATGDGLSQPSSQTNGHQTASHTACSESLPNSCQPSSKIPKKGILKNLHQRESGYSSSPERGDFVEGCRVSDAKMGKEEPQTRGMVARRKKGILKRNGKFSTSLDLPDNYSTLQFSEDVQPLIFSVGCRGHQQAPAHSRSPSVISDDSLLSSDSFDLLDLAAQTKRRLFAQSEHHDVYSSEEELENPRGRGEYGEGKLEEEISLKEGKELCREAQVISSNL
ncbi:NUAK family SNF1-like kinase 1 isoform X2 [Lepisosteus oculatus]|uniref:NUAK family SNF1-like kinase 1 isoform X2 n=1 Tax=Lepisosteus oculatus TaxID=7918 RepID=UPI003719D4FB